MARRPHIFVKNEEMDRKLKIFPKNRPKLLFSKISSSNLSFSGLLPSDLDGFFIIFSGFRGTPDRFSGFIGVLLSPISCRRVCKCFFFYDLTKKSLENLNFKF